MSLRLDEPGLPDKMNGMNTKGESRVPGLPGLVMFPFGVLVMGRALARSESALAASVWASVTKMRTDKGTFPSFAARAGKAWPKNGNVPLFLE